MVNNKVSRWLQWPINLSRLGKKLKEIHHASVKAVKMSMKIYKKWGKRMYQLIQLLTSKWSTVLATLQEQVEDSLKFTSLT